MLALDEYNRKRHFTTTREPRAKTAKKDSGKPEFVVQKHAASHLHYDFRLEINGVLKSWAVPKGPSLDPSIKRLAMQVEDHPYEYRKFEGTIAKGNYGAGQVIVWDRGSFEPLAPLGQKDLVAGLKTGHLSFILYGEKLKGEFTLVKNYKMADNAWLLIKKDDHFAKPRGDVLDLEYSVISGNSIEDLKRAGSLPSLDQAKKASYPRKIKPMLATLVEQPFDNAEWLFEIKWDGYRAIGGWDGTTPQLYSRNGSDFLPTYKAIADDLRKLKHPAIMDGEIVIVDKGGKATFSKLQNYAKKPSGRLIYYAFDLLWYDGHDLRDLPLIDRKQMLKQLISTNEAIEYCDHIRGRGRDFFMAVSNQGLEGMMAKKAESIYRDGYRSKLWLKVKTHKRQEVVIGGFSEPKGSRKSIGALLTGVYENGELIYSGRVGSGIPSSFLPDLRRQLDKLENRSSPFLQKIKPNGEVHWVEPKLVAEVSFSEWTRAGHMRQPIFEGMRTDKNPQDIRKQLPQVNSSDRTKTQAKAAVDRVSFTHLEKRFWPELGISKGDLVDYYKNVQDTMLPYLLDRPCNLLRHPNGPKGKSFYQKDMQSLKLPKWAKTVSVYSESNQKKIEYFVINCPDSLFYLVQLGCIEINPWSSRRGSLDSPDWAVIDLDPEGVEFTRVVEVALEVKKVCDNLKVPSYAKTSGQTGIHIFIPTGAKYSYPQVRQFSELIAHLTHQTTGPLTSLIRSPAKRQHKIYLDYLQNRESQTLVAPYSVRPSAEATVSAPLKWEEVNYNLRPQDFTLKTMPARLKEVGDLWKPVLEPGVDIRAVLKQLN